MKGASDRANRRPRLSSLRARLIASHVLVILLALALVLVMSAGFLRRYEERAEIARLRELAEPLAVEAGTFGLLSDDAGRARTIVLSVFQDQADQLELRILLIRPDDAQVVLDTDGTRSLRGQALTGYAHEIRPLAAQERERLEVDSTVASSSEADDPLSGNRVVLAAVGEARLILVLAAPPDRVPLVARFLPPLLLVASISLAVASLAGLLLSRRIAAPVNRLTRAADEMASGRLEQRVAGEDVDEIGRLVASFNSMSHTVAQTDRIQREFLATIAHELRTPLTSIQGYTVALRDGVIESQPDVERALVTIERETGRMASLIRQLHDLARLESGQARLTMQPVDVQSLFARVTERFASAAERRQIEFLIDSPRDLRVLGDEERLVQALSNLVANALRHTKPTGHVTLAGIPVASPDATTSSRVRLTVQDTGEGILPEQLPRIFDRFARGEQTGDGFGLGLGLG
ncbi:MAG: sensor histidine kinase, partial [Thermomicrobiales bacterium]